MDFWSPLRNSIDFWNLLTRPHGFGYNFLAAARLCETIDWFRCVLLVVNNVEF
jgi:hypothetical protein